MKIKIQDPEFGDFDRNGIFEMHLFEVRDGNLCHSIGSGGHYELRATIAPEHVRAYTIQNSAARKAKITLLK